MSRSQILFFYNYLAEETWRTDVDDHAARDRLHDQMRCLAARNGISTGCDGVKGIR